LAGPPIGGDKQRMLFVKMKGKTGLVFCDHIVIKKMLLVQEDNSGIIKELDEVRRIEGLDLKVWFSQWRIVSS
jgi:hypothetical protein